MNEGDVLGVLCPCCHKQLYQVVMVANQGLGIPMGVKDNPKIQTDGEGLFMKCQACSRRIAFMRTFDGPSGASFVADPVQKCDKTLP